MYHIYSTEGIILRAVNLGESDRFLTILTRELGLIKVEARAVRKIESKLRYSTQLFSLGQFSLVKGKGKWRLANACIEKNIWSEIPFAARSVLSRTASLIIRLVHGEEKNEVLFDNFKNAASYIAFHKPERHLLVNCEYVLVLRMLHSLGYLGERPRWDIFTSTPLFETDLIMRIDESKRAVLDTINRSLRESHL